METTNNSDTPAPRPRPPLLASILYYLFMALGLAVLSAGLFLMSPAVVSQFQQRFQGAAVPQAQATAPAAPLAPLTAAQLAEIAKTAAEQQTLKQAIPTEDARKPPLLPVQATAAAVAQPQVAPADAAQYSPVDLGWAPLPTPTSMLSQEQYDASQASEEQQFIDNAEQGLTEAQKLVKIHEAEQQAKGQP